MRCLVFCLLAIAPLAADSFEPSIHLVLLGDVMLGRGVAEAHASGDWDSVLRSISPITRAADWAAVNLESPIGCGASGPSGPLSLTAPPAAAAALTSAGVDLVSTVNNHAQDAGPRGSCTREVLIPRGIAVLDSPAVPLDIDVRGLLLVFLALDFTGEVPPESIAILEREVHSAAESGKIVVVSLHWGMEYQSGRDSLQEQIADRLVHAGADILWGHHPHVMQELEWRGGALVLYSLGNAVFDQPEPEAARRGTLIWAEVDRRGVHSAAILPFAIDPRSGRTGAPDFSSLRISFSSVRDVLPGL
jgi:poly-gamma-glutamate capsule biosynthesis protein CapA/YwtB (metallophosphatase superfamily)